ncbi:hypothetical protein MKK70_18075 [Methylobacterium sp. E-041]|jgi:hypothetical protein|uniref:hypothetical protein n=2 Tax=Methylobacterium TaxID=407 RepID=UPI0006F2B45C|nr:MULTISPECIES: hypothetical protein [unclassified Methylobacterium]RZK97062.1 MAG: hypothetical protein EOO66_04255 [Methylobacterium sp.]KQP15492.1 hypothetical protein ASF26_17390 [Methylobacterium sp. Leaf93]MCJ2020907.1 hypothetical protein [Methylobacterium sp. E-065]MCJ2077559.1 hypothetical protein [Methylobacterium sp. E-016]MCJ2107255.1 hypothetical protein [Methylobacterium sp. E-041]
MSHQTRSFAIDSSIRVGQGLALGHSAIQGAFDGLRARQDTDRHAVSRLAGRLGQARRDAVAVEAEADALAAEAAELRLLLGAALQRAAAAEARAERAERAVVAAARRQGLV